MPVTERTLSRDLVAQLHPLVRVGNAAMHQHGGRFLAILGLDREGGDIAVVEAGQLLHRPFDILRPVVLAVDDDHVLRAADDEQVAIGHVAHVAGVQPVRRPWQAFVCRFLVAEVGMHHAGAAAPDLADLVIALGRRRSRRGFRLPCPAPACRN